MNGRELSEALRGGRRVYATLTVSTSPRWPSVVKGLGLDFVFIDTEHTPIPRDKLAWMCETYRAMELAPVVRIPEPDPYLACMVLDGGACGVIAPYVETVEQVQALRGAVKLRPLKGKRLADALSGKAQLEPEVAAYLADNNAGNVLIVNIESRPAIEALDDLLAVPGLDAVLIGPHDLSINLGVPEQYDHPVFNEAVRDVIRRARAKGVGAGVHFWPNVEKQIDWGRDGANIIIHGSDLQRFSGAIQEDIGAIREALGDQRDAGDIEGAVT